MKTLVQNYIFDPPNKTITILGMPDLGLEQLLLIVNKSTPNVMIYNFADANLSGSIINNIITLSCTTIDILSMSSTDSLQIYIDVPNPNNIDELYPLEEQYTYDTNMEKVLGSQPLTESGALRTKTIFADRKNAGFINSLNGSIGIDCSGMQTVAIHISGTWAGTISFDAYSDSGNFVPINGMQPNGTSLVGSITSNGLLRFNVAGLARIQARLGSYTSGGAIISLIATAGQSGILGGGVTAIGSQSQLLTQRATTFELTTYDTNVANVFGGTKLWRDGLYTVDYSIAPTVNPTLPATYTDNKYAQYPQKLPRLRVEIGGSEKLPFAQETNTNKLMVSNDDERRLLEDILFNLQLLNQNFAVANSLTLPQVQSEIK